MVLIKTALFSTALLAANLQPSAAWWDNGHMLIGEVASQLLEQQDRETLEKVLNKWEEDFPNTNRIFTAAVWPDLIKCTKQSSSCGTPLVPSLMQMEDWHYVNLPININATKWLGKDADVSLFKVSIAGKAIDILEKAFQTFNTTKSGWAANFMLRNFIHVFGDEHLPVHTIGGISDRYPKGDLGGNMEAFALPCAASNLHALWDSVGGVYTNNWAEKMPFEDQLRKNASELAEKAKAMDDPLHIEALKDLSYGDFAKEMVDNLMLKKVILTTYQVAEQGLYSKLEMSFDNDGKLKCPPQEYFDYVFATGSNQIALAGKRLAVMLTQIARQIRVLDIKTGAASGGGKTNGGGVAGGDPKQITGAAGGDGKKPAQNGKDSC